MCVVGIPAGSTGETVAAAVVLRPGAQLDERALRSWGKERLAAYKVPHRFVSAGELPKSMLGKVIRKDVAKLFEG